MNMVHGASWPAMLLIELLGGTFHVCTAFCMYTARSVQLIAKLGWGQVTMWMTLH